MIKPCKDISKMKYGIYCQKKRYSQTLSLWDYIFNTHHIPHDGRDIELGFHDEEEFPETFVKQSMYPMKTKK